MASFTSRTTAASTATAHFTLSGRVPAGAAALMLSVSALAMTTGTAQASCDAVGTPAAQNITCDNAPVPVNDNLLDAGAGDDTITITGGPYGWIDGGTDNDTLILNSPGFSTNIIEGGTGNDTINLISGTVDNWVAGEEGDDTITLNGALVNGFIRGDFFGSGNDTILLLDGTVTGDVDGDAGNDTIALNGATVGGNILGDIGDDDIHIDGGSVAGDVLGGTGNDTLRLHGGIYSGNADGGAGDDFIEFGLFFDPVLAGSLLGDTGNDTIDVYSGTVTDDVRGGDGNDTITLHGGVVADEILGNNGDDTIILLGGVVNRVVGDDGASASGPGNDTITLNGASVVTDVRGNGGEDIINILSGTVGGFVLGGDANDTITMSGGSVVGDLRGGLGDDTLIVDGGIVGANGVNGQGGNDTITLNAGTIGSMTGGPGNDVLVVNGGAVSGEVNGGSENDVIDLNGGVVGSVEGGLGNDTITLNGGSVVGDLHGGDDDDIINLLAGTVGGNVLGDVGPGDDTITLDGATVLGSIDGEAGNDTIDLLSGLVGENVLGGTGNDTITLNGATVTGLGGAGGINGGAGDDIIDLFAGFVGIDARGEDGNDTITLDGATIADDINGGNGDDTITLSSGAVLDDVGGGAGIDTITLNGASVAGTIIGDSGNDDIDLLSGFAGNVLGGEGIDNIELDGAVIGGNVGGGLDSDIILLQSGLVGGSVAGNEDNDAITLNGATITGDLQGNDGNDLITLISGSFGGDLLGGSSSDLALILPGYDLSTIVGNLDGTSGFIDVLEIQASGTLTGERVLNWDVVDVNGATVVFEGAGLTTSSVLGMSAIFGGTIDFDDGFDLVGDLTISPSSTLLAGTPSGTGVYSVSDDMRNFGTTDMSDGFGAGDTLSIGDDYTSGGELLLDVALNSTEAGDSLVIGDNILFGPTEITFTDTDPSGDPSFTGTGAGNGIVVVDNSAGGHIVDGDFIFDPISHPTNEILKVPFVYTLSLESDDILYLQSDVLAQVYGYAILSEMMRDQFPTLRDRLGDMRYNGYDSEGNPELGLDNAGLWARIDGSKRDIEHDGGHNTGEWNDTRGEASIGIDIPMETFGGVGVFGVSIHAVRGYADANSGLTPDPNVAEVDTTGFGGGLSFAWFPGGGFYADVQGRVTGWDADVENEARDLKQDIDGLGWGASLEVGNRFQIAPNTAIIPRGQVVYTDVDFDSFKDDDGVDVSQDDSASVVIGPGVTIEQMFPDNGVAMFLDASVKHELLDESSIDASGFRFKSGLEDTWGTVSFGASLGVAEGASAYVVGDVSSPLTSTFGDSYGYGLRAGVRIDF